MKRTSEEAKAWKATMAGLAKQIRAMPAEMRAEIQSRFGVVTCEGRPLSPFNCCYLWTQTGGKSTMVGGFRQWQKAGRQVRKGEHAAGYIYVPTGGAKSEPGAIDDAAGETRTRFMLVPVFDVGQTEEIGATAETMAAVA